MTYGVPYRGSKNRIAKDIIALLPEGRRLVDLFVGGCAITHCALLSGKWQTILNNDLLPLGGQTLFRLACQGEYNKEEYYRIPTKQEFYEKRDVEPHMIAIWGWNCDR
jgi:site-specific DNA-adenine methylase